MTRLVLAACLALATSAGAQAPEVPPAPCPYMRCALGIAPVWNGLAVVRGSEHERIASLDFFRPRPIEAVFMGDSARAAAQRAFIVRQRASLLTDLGALLLVAGGATAAHEGHFSNASRAVAAAGATAFAISVPLQFAADGWLSRAVWWSNAELSR